MTTDNQVSEVVATGTTRRRTRANGEGGVWFDKARDRWVGSITTGYVDGKQIRKSVTGKTKKATLDKLRAVENAADHGIDLMRENVTVARYLDDWVKDSLPGTVRASTLQQYSDVVRLYIIPVLGQKRLRTLGPRDVAKMQRVLATEYVRKPATDTEPAVLGLSPHTQRIARSVLRRALREAQIEGQLDRNVASIARGVKIDASEGRTLTPDEAKRLLIALDGHRLEAAFTVALSLGLRLGELLGLAWPDLDLGERPRLTVRRALKRIPRIGLVLEDTKTASSRRTVFLPSTAAGALKAHSARQAAERLKAGPEWHPLPLGVDLVFRTPFGTAIDPNNFRHTTYAVTEEAGIGKLSPHTLRHSAASLLIAQGLPLKIISEMLGHSSIRITADTYGHLLDPSREEAAEAMERALWGAK